MPNHRSTHQLLCLLMLAHVVELDQIYPVLASLSCLTVVNSHVVHTRPGFTSDCYSHCENLGVTC